MTLFYFVVGIVLAFVIARYNESNKLFWILFTSFMLGIAGTTIWNKIHSKDEIKTNVTTYPTQTSLASFTPLCVLANEEPETPAPLRTESVIRNTNCSNCLISSTNINNFYPRDKRLVYKSLTKLCISNISTLVDFNHSSGFSLVKLNNL